MRAESLVALSLAAGFPVFEIIVCSLGRIGYTCSVENRSERPEMAVRGRAASIGLRFQLVLK